MYVCKHFFLHPSSIESKNHRSRKLLRRLWRWWRWRRRWRRWTRSSTSWRPPPKRKKRLSQRYSSGKIKLIFHLSVFAWKVNDKNQSFIYVLTYKYRKSYLFKYLFFLLLFINICINIYPMLNHWCNSEAEAVECWM